MYNTVMEKRIGYMNEKDIMKALVNALLAWLVFALIISVKKDIGFVNALNTMQSFITAVSAGVGSYIGLGLRKNR